MFTGSRWVILLNGFLLSSRFTGSRWVILLNGFQTIVQQIHRETLGYFSQRVPDYCTVDFQGVAGLFFSTDSRLLSSRFTGSRWVILPNGFQTIVQQILRDRWVILLNGFQTIVQQIHRESLGYSSQRVLDYCPVDSQGVARLFFSTGSRLLSSRFTGSLWVILLNGFQTIVQQIHRESLGYSSQRVLDVQQIHRETLGYSSQRVPGQTRCPGYSNGFHSSRFSGSRWVILLNGFQTIFQQIHRESLGYSSQRVLDYCPVDSQGVARLFFSTGSRLLSSRFTGSRWVILLNGFQNIVQQIHRESLGYSSQRVPDYCPVDSEGFAGSFFSTGSRLMPSRYSQGFAGIFFSTGSRLLSSRFTGSRWVILLNGFQTIVQQILRDSLGHSSQRVLDYCQVDSLGVAGLFFSTGSRILFSRFTESRWVILLNGFQTIVQQILRDSLGHSSQRVLDYCPVDSQGVD